MSARRGSPAARALALGLVASCAQIDRRSEAVGPLHDAAPDGAADGGVAEPSRPWASYEEAKAALAARRFAGPRVPKGAVAACSANRLSWRETDGTVHSWSAKTRASRVHAFREPSAPPLFAPSDDLVAVRGPVGVEVFRTEPSDARVASLGAAEAWMATDGAVLTLDPPSAGTTRARVWRTSTQRQDELPFSLDTSAAPIGAGSGALVVPSGRSAPLRLFVVDPSGRPPASHAFTGGTVEAALPTQPGLLVAYARSDGSALVRYPGDGEDGRVEIGDAVAALGTYFDDSPDAKSEHGFARGFAQFGRTVVYGSPGGVWSYDLESGALAPVQLPEKRGLTPPDLLCVMSGAELLAYRSGDDTSGQVWVVPLAPAP